MTEKISSNQENDSNQKRRKVTVEHNTDGIYVGFQHKSTSMVFPDYEGEGYGSFLVGKGIPIPEAIFDVKRRDPEALPEVIVELQTIAESSELDSEKQQIDHAIKRLSRIASLKEDSKRGFLTRKPHPRTSSEAVDVFWFKHIRDNS